MLSQALHEQIFKDQPNALSDRQKKKIEIHLKTHGLYNKSTERLGDISFQLPKLKGGNIDQHFRIIAQQINGPYVKFAESLERCTIPKPPKAWARRPGWSRYDPVTGASQAVDHPTCKALVFDMEVLVPEGNFPTMATAVSPDYWYSWASPRIFDQKHYLKTKLELSDLINFQKRKFFRRFWCLTVTIINLLDVKFIYM